MKKLNNLLTFFMLLAVVVGVYFFNNVGTYSNDDWWAGFYWSNDIIKNILYSDQGLVWSWHFGKFVLQIIPSVLHIHPQQNMLLPVVKGIDFAICVAILSMFFNIKYKKIPHPIVVLANILLVFYVVFTCDLFIIIQANQHFKYTFNLIIGSSVWYIWINEFLNNKFLSEGKLIRDCFFIFLLVFAGHVVNIPTCILFGILFVSEAKNRGDFCINILKLLRTNFPLIIMYVICMIIYFNLPGMLITRSVRLPQEPILNYSVSHFIEFTQLFFSYIFESVYRYGLLLAALVGFICLLINIKRIDKKYLIISTAVFIANFLFQYSLLTCGKTFYNNGTYWFISGNLTSTFLFYLIMDCNIIYGCLFNVIRNSYAKAAFIISCFIVINLIYPMPVAVENLKDTYQTQLIQREAIYKWNKICRYYSIKGNAVFVPEEYYNKLNIAAYQDVWNMANANFYKIYKYRHGSKRFILIHKKLVNENELFSKEELSNINFKKLYDDAFILKMKEPMFQN